MNKQDKIREKLKDYPELLEEFERTVNAPRERNEIYMYCLERQTFDGKINYVPLISFWNNEPVLMACNDVKILQEDYAEEVRTLYKKVMNKISIIEVPFWKYVEIHNSMARLNLKSFKEQDAIREFKMLYTLTNTFVEFRALPMSFQRAYFEENSYCKCLDKDLNLIQCTNYKPIF